MSAQASTTRLICPLTAPTPREMRAQMEAASRQGADAVECRLDFLAAVPTADQVRELLRD